MERRRLISCLIFGWTLLCTLIAYAVNGDKVLEDEWNGQCVNKTILDTKVYAEPGDTQAAVILPAGTYVQTRKYDAISGMWQIGYLLDEEVAEGYVAVSDLTIAIVVVALEDGTVVNVPETLKGHLDDIVSYLNEHIEDCVFSLTEEGVIRAEAIAENQDMDEDASGLQEKEEASHETAYDQDADGAEPPDASEAFTSSIDSAQTESAEHADASREDDTEDSDDRSELESRTSDGDLQDILLPSDDMDDIDDTDDTEKESETAQPPTPSPEPAPTPDPSQTPAATKLPADQFEVPENLKGIVMIGTNTCLVEENGTVSKVKTITLPFGESNAKANRRVAYTKATAEGSIPLLSEPKPKSRVLGYLKSGTLVGVIKTGSNYCRVFVDGVVGCIGTNQMTFVTVDKSPMGTGVLTVNGIIAADTSVNILSAAVKGYLVDALPCGQKVDIWEKKGNYYQIEANGLRGWVHQTNLTESSTMDGAVENTPWMHLMAEAPVLTKNVTTSTGTEVVPDNSKTYNMHRDPYN